LKIAIITKTSSFGSNVILGLRYDDSAMKLVSVFAVNHSGRDLVIEITEPKTFIRSIPTGTDIDISIPPGQQSKWVYGIRESDGETRIRGIDWRAGLVG